jgi:hypothetical protein
MIPPLAWCRMSLECIVGTCNLLATLVTLSLQLWKVTGKRSDMIDMSHQSWWGLLWIFQKGTCEPAGKAKKPSSWHWFLIINIQSNMVAIVSSIITKIFNPRKYWMVTIQPFIKTLRNSVSVLFIASLLFDFCSICFLLFDSVLCLIQCSISQCSIVQCIFLIWYWNCIPGNSIP